MTAVLTVTCDRCGGEIVCGRVLLRVEAGTPEIGPIGPDLKRS
jgi:hypothetical protein